MTKNVIAAGPGTPGDVVDLAVARARRRGTSTETERANQARLAEINEMKRTVDALSGLTPLHELLGFK